MRFKDELKGFILTAEFLLQNNHSGVNMFGVFWKKLLVMESLNSPPVFPDICGKICEAINCVSSGKKSDLSLMT